MFIFYDKLLFWNSFHCSNDFSSFMYHFINFSIRSLSQKNIYIIILVYTPILKLNQRLGSYRKIFFALSSFIFIVFYRIGWLIRRIIIIIKINYMNWIISHRFSRFIYSWFLIVYIFLIFIAIEATSNILLINRYWGILFIWNF